MSEKYNYTIIIPSYKPNIQLVRIIRSLRINFNNIIVVDDGSGEESKKIFGMLQKIDGVFILKHAVNQGKGRALKTAFNHYLLDMNADGVITVDGDGQHEVDDILRIAKTMEEHSNSVVLGCRSFYDKNIPFRSRFGNRISRVVYYWACGLKLSDTQTGLRGIPNELVPLCCRIAGEKYDYETNMLLTFKDQGALLEEISIKTVYENDNNSSHFNPIKDSILIYAIIIKYSFSSLITSIIDYILFVIILFWGGSIIQATYGARLLASFFNFSINKKLVFRSDNNGLVEFFKYIVLVVASGFLSGKTIEWLTRYIPSVSAVVIKIPVEIVLYLFNYMIQRRIIFNGKKK